QHGRPDLHASSLTVSHLSPSGPPSPSIISPSLSASYRYAPSSTASSARRRSRGSCGSFSRSSFCSGCSPSLHPSSPPFPSRHIVRGHPCCQFPPPSVVTRVQGGVAAPEAATGYSRSLPLDGTYRLIFLSRGGHDSEGQVHGQEHPQLLPRRRQSLYR